MRTFKYLLFASMLIFSGCADDGEPGPKGDVGEQGAIGDPGPKGEPGTVNVMYSDWINAEWNPGRTFRYMAIGEPKCTIGFHTSGGIVLSYFRYWAATDIKVFQMPYTHYGSANYKVCNPIFSDTDGRIIIELESIDGSDLTESEAYGSAPALLQFQYILIPGGSSLLSGRFAPPVDYSDYEAVKAYYNIPD